MPDFGVERYLNVRSARGASLAPDGTLAFLLDTTGVPQVWTVDEPTGWPTQHTFGDERATFVEWSPERREFAFGRDEGGNERVQILLGNPSTGETTDLTATPDAKHRWGGWRPDGERFAFAANRRDESAFDVHVADRDGADERVHETTGWFDVAGWSPDGDRLALVESRSSFDQDVYVLDPGADERRRRTPAGVEARYGGVEWGPAGEWLYLVTDRASDTLRLERVPADGPVPDDGDEGGSGNADAGGNADHGFEVVVAGGEWEVDGVSVDPDTGRIAYSRNVDGYTELTLGRLEGGVVVDASTPELPEGVAGGVAWDDDGERVALTATGRTENANVHAVGGDGLTRLTDAGTAGIPRDTFVAPELVRYPGTDGLEVPAFFSLPPADTGHGETPVVVDVHGGPESQRRPSFSPVTQYLLAQGYAVFEPNVRGSAGYGREYAALDDVEGRLDAVADLRAGAEWLSDHPAVDPDRIAVMGASYGGYMTLAALTEHPDLWAAGVDVVGIANFVTFLENTGDWRRSLREAEYGSLSEDRDLLERISPINRIDRIEAPLFVLHGENDPRVPVDEARQIVEAAREEAGVPVQELIFPDEGHGFSKLENRVEAYTAVVEFLDEHV
ncbi:MAG: prolyl oligopeptidase family serine peptidase [Haloferacaceae archaeon]